MIYMYTANPTWGDIFECCFKAQSSKLERLFSLKRGKKDVRALSFRKCHPKWDWLYTYISSISWTSMSWKFHEPNTLSTSCVHVFHIFYVFYSSHVFQLFHEFHLFHDFHLFQWMSIFSSKYHEPMNVISVTNPMHHPHINYFIYIMTFISSKWIFQIPRTNERNFCHEPNAPSTHQLFHLSHVFHDFHLFQWMSFLSSKYHEPMNVISVFCHKPTECHNSRVQMMMHKILWGGYGQLNYRSLLQNIVSFVGLFCKRDL